MIQLLLAWQKGVTTKSDIITVVVKKKLQILSQKSRFLKENANNKYRNFSEEEKKVKIEYGRNSYRNTKRKTS